MKKSALMEGLLGLAFMVAMNFLFFSGNLGFFGVNPHPYLLVVLLIATRYGVWAGAWTGLLAAGTMVGMVFLGQPDLLPGQFITLRNFATPILFLAVGVVFGEIREGQKRKEVSLETELEELKESSEELAARYEALGSAKDEVDSRVVSQEHTLSTLYEAAQGLKSLEEKDIYPAVLGLLEEFLSIEASSIYLMKDGVLKREAMRDSGEPGNRPGEIVPDGGLVGQTMTRKETVALNRYIASGEPEAARGLQPAIVAPIMNSKNEVQGILQVEKLPFLKFNHNTIRMTALLADWCGAAVANARTYQSAEDGNISDPSTGAYKYRYFQTRFEEEFGRARRYNLPLSLLVLDLLDFQQIADAEKEKFLPVFTGLVRQHVRNVDLLFHDQTGSRYYLVLTNTPLKGAEVALKKITREIEAFKFKPYPDQERHLALTSRAAQLDEKMGSPEELVKRVEEGLSEN
jgi:diguanylate cyclase (GGDEF)-like protein